MKTMFIFESVDPFDIPQGAFRRIFLSYFFSAHVFLCECPSTMPHLRNNKVFLLFFFFFSHGILTTLVNIQDESFHILGRHTLNHF